MFRFSSNSSDAETQIIETKPNPPTGPHKAIEIEASQDRRFRLAQTVILDTDNAGRRMSAKERRDALRKRKILVKTTILLGAVTFGLLLLTVGQMISSR